MKLDATKKRIAAEMDEVREDRNVYFANGDDAKFEAAHKRMKWLGNLYSRVIAIQARIKSGMVPSVKTGYGYTRYETLPEKLYSRIEQIWIPFYDKNIYFVDGIYAKDLKDAVAYCR